MSVRQLVTAEQLWEMPEVPGKRFELVDGEVVELPGAGALHGKIVLLICKIIDTFAAERRLGETSPDGVSYILSRDPDRVRIPDVSFVSVERVPESGVPEGFWPFAPDLAVEVVSPADRADDVHDKALEYIACGARLVWVVWPKHRSVTVHVAGGVIRELGPDAELDGGDVLPGFNVRVADLFPARP